MIEQGSAEPETVLVLTPGGRNGALTCDLIARDGHEARLCIDADDLCQAIAEGAGVALVSEEVLSDAVVTQLSRVLAEQPAWSDFPLVVFSALATTGTRSFNDRLMVLGNVTFLDRPVHVRTMLAAVHTALRARRRQYASRRAITSRDQFLAMLGHELRNPLGAIQLASELLPQVQDEPDRERHRAIIARQTRHLTRLVDDLLDVARVTYGKVNLQFQAVDLGEVARSCLDSLAPSAVSREIQLTTDGLDAPAMVWGDLVRLEQILSNLLTNAIKYTPKGGSVRLELECTAEDHVVRVTDSGIGIPPGMLDDVFDLFTQADGGLARSQGGMGLGLTLVRSLVRLHHGSVVARSAGLGRGSEFEVTLPRLAEAECRHSQPPPLITPDATLKVVVVEDNEDLRLMQEEVLRLAGHEVHHAADGPSAVELILRESPDVALVDIGLPGFDGFEVARRVRARLRTPVRLIAVTGYGQADDRERALRAGFDAHLTKPVGFADLSARMREG